MSNKISFGKYEGKTYEWLFFHKPSYVEYIIENEIHLQEDRFTDEESKHFLQLYEHAWSLGGRCCQCAERCVTRMGLTTSFKHGELLAVGFYCDECEHLGGARTGYYPPSFFVDAYTLEPREKKMVINEIKKHYLGPGNLTQKKMEEFFANQGNFTILTGPQQATQGELTT